MIFYSRSPSFFRINVIPNDSSSYKLFFNSIAAKTGAASPVLVTPYNSLLSVLSKKVISSHSNTSLKRKRRQYRLLEK